MSTLSSTKRKPHRGHRRVAILGIALLSLFIVRSNNLLSDARFTGTYDLLPPDCSKTSERIVGAIRNEGEYALKLYTFAVASALVPSRIRHQVEQSSVPEISNVKNEVDRPNEEVGSALHAPEPVDVLRQSQHRVFQPINSLCEKVVRSAVGIRLPTHTTILGRVYPAAIRTNQYVEPSPSLGTA